MLRLAASCLAPEAPLAELWPVETEEDAFFLLRGGVRDTERVGVLPQIQKIKCAFGGGQCTKKPFNWDGREMGPNLPLLQGQKQREREKKISLQQIKTKIPGPASSQHGNAMHWLCTEVSLFYVLISADFLWHLQERVEGVVIHSLSCFCKYWGCNKGSWELLWLPVKSCLYCWC